MATRCFETAVVADFYSKFRPSPPEKLIEKIIEYLRNEVPEPNRKLIDVGCGNGQLTERLSEYFEKVIGTDVSAAQIARAKKNRQGPNVTYRVSPAEVIMESMESVDMITSCQAAHWFDLDKFFNEAKRVLVPNGVLAIIGYGVPVLEDSEKTPELQKAFNDVYFVDLWDYWEKNLRMVENEYKDIQLPFRNVERSSGFLLRKSVTVSDVIGYINTWSAMDALKRNDPEKGREIAKNLEKKLLEILNVDDPDNANLTIRFDYFLVMGRK